MKTLSVPSLAVTFAGCFFGAGFVSGQELWQFFGAFGAWGFWGLALSMGLFFALGVIVLRTASRSGILEMDKLVIPWQVPWLRRLMGGVTCFFMFGIFVIMAAGADALAMDFLGLPHMLGGALLCLCVVIVGLFGLGGMVAVFTWLVPILMGWAVIICCIALYRFGIPTQFPTAPVDNPMLQHWAISAVSYVSYNMVCSIGMLAPLSQGMQKKTVYRGIGLGTIFMAVMAGFILVVMASVPQVTASQLPMLELAKEISATVGIVYGVLLFGGMFGAAQGCAIAVLVFLEQKFPKVRAKRAMTIIAMGILAWLSSGFGFGNLVGTVYPIFGYVSLLALACLVYRAVRGR